VSKTQAAAYLAGMIDGEGCVRVRTNRSVSVSSTDYELIEACVRCCELLGLRHRISKCSAKPGRKPAWELYINGKDSLVAVQQHVPIQCHRKQAALAEAIAAYKNKPRPSKEWLEQKYLVDGLSLQQVAEAWGVKHNVSAHCWLKYYGIPRRNQSEAQRKYPRPDAAWLREKYHAEGLSLAEIARLTGAPHAATVHGWMRSYEIPTRPRPSREADPDS
jgi:hypothetical protein